MGLTIGRPFVFEEISIRKRLVTGGADKTVRVPLCVEGGNVIFSDGHLAPGAFGCKHGEIAPFAIGFFVFFVEPIFAEWIITIVTDKTLGVPGSIQGGDTFV